jgi:hypothetical protein
MPRGTALNPNGWTTLIESILQVVGIVATRKREELRCPGV